MDNYTNRSFNCLERVHYVTFDPEMLPLTPAETPLFAGVTTAWNQLKDWATGQEGGKRAFHEGVLSRRLVIRNLRGAMLGIAEMARSIELAGVDPGISERFRMPAQRTYAALLASAEAFAEAAEPAKALCIERGMAATFVDDLEALIALFEANGGTRAGGLARQISGTAGMKIVAKTGMNFVRQLRPMVRARLKANPALAAAWDLASRMEAAPSSPSPVGAGTGTGETGGTGTLP